MQLIHRTCSVVYTPYWVGTIDLKRILKLTRKSPILTRLMLKRLTGKKLLDKILTEVFRKLNSKAVDHGVSKLLAVLKLISQLLSQRLNRYSFFIST